MHICVQVLSFEKLEYIPEEQQMFLFAFAFCMEVRSALPALAGLGFVTRGLLGRTVEHWCLLDLDCGLAEPAAPAGEEEEWPRPGGTGGPASESLAFDPSFRTFPVLSWPLKLS